MNATMVKNVRVFVVAILLVIGSMALMSCQSQEEEVRSAANAELSSLKNLDDAALDSLAAESGASADLEMFGINSNELLKSWLDGFDYTIDNVTVEGDSATATVTLKHKSLEEAMEKFNEEVTGLMTSEDTVGMSQTEIFEMLGQTLLSNIQDASMKDSTVELPFEKRDGKWTPSSNAASILGETFAEGLV